MCASVIADRDASPVLVAVGHARDLVARLVQFRASFRLVCRGLPRRGDFDAATGHLPAIAALTPLTPIVILRTVGLNALLGLAFGWLFWRRGLEHAMVAHIARILHFGLLPSRFRLTALRAIMALYLCPSVGGIISAKL